MSNMQPELSALLGQLVNLVGEIVQRAGVSEFPSQAVLGAITASVKRTTRESEINGQHAPELLADLAWIVGDKLKQSGTAEEEATRIALEASDEVRKQWGGSLLYIPKRDKRELTQRDLEIWNDFDGKNIRHVARKHALCDQQVYRIISKVRAAQMKRTQPDLFQSEESL